MQRGLPRLLSADEFFTAAQGFEHVLDSEGAIIGRRMLPAAAAAQGYAEFAVAVGEFLLDIANAQGSKTYTSVYMSGTFYPPGGSPARWRPAVPLAQAVVCLRPPLTPAVRAQRACVLLRRRECKRCCGGPARSSDAD